MRPLRAIFDLNALRQNYRLARTLHGGRALAVVKADAYGHGAVRCAQALAAETDGFAVAMLEEALVLRAAGITQPILLLEGWFEPAELEEIAAQRLWTVLHSTEQWAQLHDWLRSPGGHTLTEPLNLWLKFNSGMNRLGLPEAGFIAAWQALHAEPRIALHTVMSHFARADEWDCPATAAQIAHFQQLTAGWPVARSLANSAAILAWPAARADWARPGLMLYGGSPISLNALGRIPVAGSTPASELAAALSQLQPVMNLDSRLIAVHTLAAGEAVGYGAGFVAQQPMRIGVVACGYADGYPRIVGSGTPVQLATGQPSRGDQDRGGQNPAGCEIGPSLRGSGHTTGWTRSALLGRVSMDMLVIDLSAHPHAQVGTPVRLWGQGLPAHEIASAAQTLDYELFCGIKRAQRIYLG